MTITYITIEEADNATLQHNQWFDVAKQIKQERDKKLRQDLNEFIQSMPKSFRIARRQDYLLVRLEKLSSACYNMPTQGFYSAKYKAAVIGLIKRFKYELASLEYTDSNRLTEAQIEIASDVDCSIFFDKVRRSGNNKVTICIFHNEDTPSMVLFKEKGFHCFGCGKHGTAIDIMMQLNQLNFIEAVKKLQL